LADRHGAILERGKERYRIPDPLFSIIDAVHEFRAADTHDDARRFATLARLQELFPEDQREQLRLDPYMRRFRVFHATASLHLETTADQSFQFDPVVFGRHIVERVQAGEETAVSEHESLLPPHLQAVFARQRFPRDDGVRDRYAVEGGVYVYLDQPLKDALAVVHKVQRADPEMRKRFARSPQLYIRDALGETIDEQAIETIFIETEQYSERVVDVGLWEPPVLPWIGRDPNDWLPERFGVQIGEKYFTLQPEDLTPLRSAVEEAIERGERTVRFGDEQIPATRRTLDSLASLIGEVKPATQAGKPDAPALEDKPRKHVLIVGENFERLDYARRPMPPHERNLCRGAGRRATSPQAAPN
jgi:hypothetical protein